MRFLSADQQGDIMQNHTRHNHYFTGLDGLRAIAIFFIVAYHFSFSWAGGGFLGVDIFFVLSGYLITCKLLENEHDFNLTKFWKGRIRRLLPATYAMIITTIVWSNLFSRKLLHTLWGDALSSAFYTTNWWFIFHKLSYFDSFGKPSPLKHLWFLAVQEQFYFIWPIVLMAGLKFFKNRKNLAIVVFIGALCSAMLMGRLFNQDASASTSRIYYGTDTRAFELLIGSWLAIILPMQKFTVAKLSVGQRFFINIASVMTLAVFLLSAIFTDEYGVFIYRGGMLLFSLNTALLIICVCHPGGFLGDLLSWKPLHWIGTRSFGIYLWHFPIMVLSTPVREIGNPSYWRVGLQLIATCIIAEVSYGLVEMPIRRYGWKGLHPKYQLANFLQWKQLPLARKFRVVTAVSLIIVLAFGASFLIKKDKTPGGPEIFPAKILASSTKKLNIKKEHRPSPPQKHVSNSNENRVPTVNKPYRPILVIGDSISLDIALNLKKKYANIKIDGKIGRQMEEAIKLAASYSVFNQNNKSVVIELGTNGYFANRQIDPLLNAFSKAHLYLVNTRVPRSWEKRVNQTLGEKAKERKNITLVDWHSIAVSHPEYFGDDGVHLNSKGSRALTNLIITALNSTVKK